MGEEEVMDTAGFFFGAAFRTLVVLIVFFFIIRKVRRPFTRLSAQICGIAMFLFFTVIPIVMTGEVLINLCMGAVTGYASYYIACKFSYL